MHRIRPIHWLAFLFFLQALFYAWFVIPQGDLPDESGHYAYVVDMIKGRPLPVLGVTDNGRGYIPANLWRDWGLPEDHHRVNYIVQHPPLYYAVAAIPYAVARKFTDNKIQLARAARTVSALSLGLLVIVIYQILLAVHVEERIALAAAAWFGLVPTVTLLSAGISNDMFLTLMCALATLHLVRFVDTHRVRDAYWVAFWLACAGATKMTAWVLIAGFLGILFFEMRLRWRQWLLHVPLILLLASSTALWWMRRNLYFHGYPFFVYGSGKPPQLPDYTALDYFRQQPFFDWLFEHFYALAGFSGYCNSAASLDVVRQFCKGVKLSVVQGASLNAFIYASLALASLLLAHTAWRAFARNNDAPVDTLQQPPSIQSWLPRLVVAARVDQRWIAAVLLASAVVAGLLFLPNSFKVDPRYSWQMQLVLTVLMMAAIIGVTLLLKAPAPLDRVLAYGPILFGLFILLLFVKAHEGYTITGRVSGVHGRYLFPFIPLLIASFGVVLGRLKLALPLAIVVTIALAWAHTNAYMNVLIPFFHLVRL